MNCLVCGRENADTHHIKTRGSGGTDDSWNLMPLCRLHHAHVHRMGCISFMKTYEQVRRFLDANGWEISFGKLVHPKK